MTSSRILCLQLIIKEMTNPLIVPQLLPTHHAPAIQETGNLGLLCQTCFQFLYRLVQLTAITGLSESLPDNLHFPNPPSNAADPGATLLHDGTCKSSDLIPPPGLHDLRPLTDPPGVKETTHGFG
jgi:hypothetical protein